MKIRPKNSILYAATGVRFSSANAGGANWRQLVFNNYRQHLLDLLTKYGEANDYGDWLNEMQHRHSQLWNAANQSGNWEDIAYENEDVGRYQQDYRGGKGNDGNYLRFGTVLLNPEDKYDFNLTGIKTNQATRYNIPDPPKRVSGDFSREGYDYRVDNYYSGITDDRRLLGRKGDWDENSQEYKDWIKLLNDRGWTMELDESDQYYKLKRLGTPDPNNPQLNPQLNSPENPNNPYSLTGNHTERYGFDWNKIGGYLKQYGPDLLAAGRLAGNLWNNERVFKESEKGIRPDLKQTYYTHRQVVGDEATKQGYYRRAAQGLTAAARPFTSDADRQMAYLMEAKRIGDEMRAQGDLADNQEIRRTSDESNQHQWANTQRATEVANANTDAINYANALRLNLRALKLSADWTSIDNELLARETRLRQKQAKNEAILDLIWALDELNRLQNDPEYLTAYDTYKSAYDEAVKKHTSSSGAVDYTAVKSDPDFRRALLNYQNIQYKYLRLQLENMLRRPRNYYAKDGMKLTFKSKDDLLYKTARDAAEHFRKMSKISSDGLNRKRIKIEKLISHPKSGRKYQQGGVAPFTVYRPAAVGGETGITTTAGGTPTTSKASSKKEGNDTLDMVKELFKAVQGSGLPSDVNSLYQLMLNFLGQASVFGTDLSTDDIASMYVKLMLEINTIKYLKGNFDKAKEIMMNNDSANEIAVNSLGQLVAQDANTKEIVYANSIADAREKGLTLLTNSQVSDMRSLSTALAGRTDLDAVLANGVGMSKIGDEIKKLIPTIGTDKLTQEGYTKVQAGQIQKGFELLLGQAPEGDYSYTKHTESQDRLRKAALGYISAMLPKNMKAILKANADLQGVKAEDLLQALIGAGDNTYLSLTFNAVTGKAAKDANGNSKSGSGTDTPSSVQFLLGNGYLLMVEFNIGNSLSVKALGRFGILLDVNKHNLGQGSTLLDVSTSLFGPILDLGKATFGGSRLNTSGYSHIILNNSDCIGVDLPVKRDSSGNYTPDFLLLVNIEKAEEQISNNHITNPNEINQIYRNFGLPDKFDANGNIITLNYRRFAAILVTLDSKALKGNVPINTNEVSEADDSERELFIETMKKSGNKDYDLSDGILWSSWGKDKLYKGTIFVPVREDIVGGYISGGQPLDTDLPNNANQVAIMQHMPKVQLYQKAPSLSSLKL